MLKVKALGCDLGKGFATYYKKEQQNIRNILGMDPSLQNQTVGRSMYTEMARDAFKCYNKDAATAGVIYVNYPYFRSYWD